MRKVTGKKKDMENGEGDEVENVESETEENGVDEDGKFGLVLFFSWGIQLGVHFVCVVMSVEFFFGGKILNSIRTKHIL